MIWILYVCMYDIAKKQPSQIKVSESIEFGKYFQTYHIHTKHTILYTVLLCYA